MSIKQSSLTGLLVAAVLVCTHGTAHADLTQRMIRTTEWLVNHSSVICIAEDPAEEFETTPKILRTLKGDSGSISWPLKTDLHPEKVFGPPASGSIRMLFIAGDGLLLQAVDLGRFSHDIPSLEKAFYGVGQFGNIHLTESSLLDAIHAQLKAEPSRLIPLRTTAFYPRELNGIPAPKSFPFECIEHTFVLIVDFNGTRRDHYLDRVRNGDIAERLHAIRELSQLDDATAYAAIQAATAATNVRPTHAIDWADHRVHPQTAISVQDAATKALKEIQSGK